MSEKFCIACGLKLNIKAEICPGCGVAQISSPVSANDERNLGMLCHLLGLFTGFLGPLVLWLMKREESPFLDSQGKEALNFQITLMLAYIASSILTVVFVGFLLLPLVFLASVIFCIMASIKVSKGEDYRYPLTLRLLR